MNTVMTPVGRIDQQHPPSPSPSPTTTTGLRRTRPVGLIDRLALRLGVALVAWSRRPRVLDDRAARARRVQSQRATERRERTMQRSALLLLPPR